MIRDYIKYAEAFHKIKTKQGDDSPLILRQYQRDFVNFVEDIKGPKRVIVLKPRQAGFTTVCASYFMWRMATNFNFRGIGVADQYDRTMEMRDIYSNFLISLPDKMKPLVEADNSERIVLDNPKRDELGESPGLGSSIKYGTARDKNAGRAGARLFAHLTECAFYLYPDDIDEGIQNSIPLFDNSYIIKESTANGKQGIGGPFYELWEAATHGDSIYKPFFVSWYEVDDYFLNVPSDFKLTDEEKLIMQIEPKVTAENLMWRRLKLTEYRKDLSLNSAALTPQERFKQDFPLTPEEAFRSSGRPIFDPDTIAKRISDLRRITPKNVKEYIQPKNHVLQNWIHQLIVLNPPRSGKQYFIGADVAEGLEQGDSSAFYIIDEELNDVAYWAGKIEPDLFGHLLVGLGELYNNALIVCENNNMGHTTVSTIKRENYVNQFKTVTQDKVKKAKHTKYGHTTTEKSKLHLLNHMIKLFRDKDWSPRWLELALEMEKLTREPNGTVILNGFDRVVAAGLAIVGWLDYRLPSGVATGRKDPARYDTWKEPPKNGDIFS